MNPSAKKGFELTGPHLSSCGTGTVGYTLWAEEHGLDTTPAEKFAPFDELREHYPDTIYGKYCRFFARARDIGDLLDSDGTARQKEGHSIAAEELQALAAEDPNFPLADEALVKAAYHLNFADTGGRDAARAQLEAVIAAWPDRPAADRAREFLEGKRPLP